MKYFLLYLVLINAYAFLIMLVDKRKAIKKKWRIPEKHLLTACAIGGSLGGLMGMQLVRHKTQHPRFAIGIPVMLVVHIVILALLLNRFGL